MEKVNTKAECMKEFDREFVEIHREFAHDENVELLRQVGNFFSKWLDKVERESHVRGFREGHAQAWKTVKTLMSFKSPEEAEQYLNQQEGENETN